jgi:hypothetical protein
VAALAELLQNLSADEVAAHRHAILAWHEHPFDKLSQQQRVRDFVSDTLER